MDHALRHSYGVTLAPRGVPGNLISQLMGHANPRTTHLRHSGRHPHRRLRRRRSALTPIEDGTRHRQAVRGIIAVWRG